MKKFKRLVVSSVLSLGVLSSCISTSFATEVQPEGDFQLFTGYMYTQYEEGFLPKSMYGSYYPDTDSYYNEDIGFEFTCGDYKYVSEYNGIFLSYNQSYISESGMLTVWADVNTYYQSESDALNAAMLVPNNSNFVFSRPLNWLGVDNNSDFLDIADEIYLLVFDANNNLVCKTGLLSASKYISKIEQDPVTPIDFGSVAVEEVDKNLLEVRWSLREGTQAKSFSLDGTDTFGILDYSDEGSHVFECSASNGVYHWKLRTKVGKVFEGDIDIVNGGSSDISQEVIPVDVLNTSEPNITFDPFPEEVAYNEDFSVVMNSDIEVTMNFNGSCDGTFKTRGEFPITKNGSYHWTAITQAGKVIEGDVMVDFIKDMVRDDTPVGQNKDTSVSNLAQTGIDSSLTRVFGSLLLMLGLSGFVAFYMKNRKKGGKNDEV